MSQYIPVVLTVFKHSTNAMCFSTPWQKARTTAKQWRCQCGSSPQSPATIEFLTAKLTEILCCIDVCPPVCLRVLGDQKLKDD